MNEPRNKPHPLDVERWLLGEQDPSERVSLEQRLSADEQARLRQEDASLRQQLLRDLPPERWVERVLARAQQRPPRWTFAARFAIPAVLVAAVLLLWRRPTSYERVHEGATAPVAERAKGSRLELRVYRRRGDHVELLQDGARASVGDVLQLGYVRAGYVHGVLLSIDGRGGVTLHHPHSGAGAHTLGDKSGEQLLGEAYELDDAPSFERFLLIAAKESLDVEAVRGAARELASDPARARAAPLSLGFANEQRSLLVEKSRAR